MPWKESPSAWRRAPRPSGWKAIRRETLARDGGQCTWLDDGVRCTEPATDVDHIGSPDDHTLDNLRALCGPHHRRRTALQARAARGEMPSRRRPPESHPGLIQAKPSNPFDAARAKARQRTDVPPF